MTSSQCSDKSHNANEIGGTLVFILFLIKKDKIYSSTLIFAETVILEIGSSWLADKFPPDNFPPGGSCPKWNLSGGKLSGGKLSFLDACLPGELVRGELVRRGTCPGGTCPF